MSTVSATLARCSDLAASALAFGPRRRVRDAGLYLAHVEAALPLRQIADQAGQALASVHRAVRRIEALRDDPLIDSAMDTLGAAYRHGGPADDGSPLGEPDAPARQALARLAATDAFLIVAAGAERAGVFVPANNLQRPVALMSVDAAAAFAARDWLRCVSRSRASSRYVLTQAGRSWLREQRSAGRDAPPQPAPAPPAETPLAWLARRRDQAGRALLPPEALQAAERLRADVALAAGDAALDADWSALAPDGPPIDSPEAAARHRAAAALHALGPGLADAAFRACCLGEGLESIEAAMGWSARSAKVVLGIALQHLANHYAAHAAD